MNQEQLAQEQLARKAFEKTRDGMGFPEPQWEDLLEETKQLYRDWVLKQNDESNAEISARRCDGLPG